MLTLLKELLDTMLIILFPEMFSLLFLSKDFVAGLGIFRFLIPVVELLVMLLALEGGEGEAR
jgi:hypothetical protein